jgi:branched-chain amino acid transport system substrate-binding protein
MAARIGRGLGIRIGGSVVIAAAGLTLGLGVTAGAATGAPLVLGDICSCTGPEASTISQTTPTIEAWESWVNGHGGIDGHQVRVIVKDDGYNPGTSLADAKQLVTENHIIALFDNSDEDASWAAYMKQQKIPVLGGTESDAGYTNSDFFPPGGTFNFATPAGAVSAKKAGIKKEADLYCVEVAICAESSNEVKSSLANVGLKLVYSAGISFAAPNYTAQCLAAKESGATAMTVADASAIVSKVAMNCASQGYSPIELSGDGSVAIAWLSIPAMQGNIDVQADLPWFVHNAATKTMYEALDKYAPAVPKGQNFGEVVLQTWIAGAELQLAVASGHLSATPTAAQITADLYSLPKGTTLGGLSPPISFVKGKPASNRCFFLMGINHKKFVTLDGLKPLCVK